MLECWYIFIYLLDSKMEAVKPDSMIIENILKKSNQLFKSKGKCSECYWKSVCEYASLNLP